MCGYEFPLDVDLIERVEVIRGPGSALYGNNAFAGIVNVVTRKGADIGGKGLEVSGSYGAYDAYSGRVSYGNKFKNGVETMVSGTWYDSQGEPRLHFPEYDYIHDGAVKNFDNERARNVFASVSVAGFTLEGVYNRRDKDIPTAGYFTVFNDKRLKLYDERAYAELRYQHEFGYGWQMQARAYYDRYDYKGTYPYETDDGVVVLNKDKPLAQMAGGEFQVSKTLAQKHHLTLGLEGRYDFEVRQMNYDTEPRYTYLDETIQPYSFGLYAQDEYAILDNLILNVGFRYDHFSLFGDTINPRAAVIFHPRKSSTFKALYGQAYRTPNAYEVSYQDADYAANSDVEPETIRSYELVWEEFIGRKFQVTGSLFYNEIASFVQQGDEIIEGETYTTFKNSAAATVLGGEAELGINWGHGLRGSLSYCFAETLETDVGNRLTNAPKHVGKAHLVVPIYKEKVFAGLELQAMSNRKTVQEGKVPAYAIVNLNFFGKEIVKNLEFSAGLYNIFDKKYDDPAGPDFLQDKIPQRERTFRLKMTYRW
jgi:iron complex outermembrane receptor protein